MGAWIEIALISFRAFVNLRRTPRWVRGLKFITILIILLYAQSHPTMGAWIEIRPNTVLVKKHTVAPHDGCVD